MLLVDHHHAERAELHPLLDQGVGADQDVDTTCHQLGSDPAPFGSGGPIGQEVDLQRSMSQQGRRIGHGHSVQKFGHPEVVLLGQHLSRCHERALATTSHRGQQGGHRHHRLA